MPSPPCLSAVSVYSVFAILGFILTVVSSHPPTHRAESSSSARRPGTTREHFMSITQFPTTLSRHACPVTLALEYIYTSSMTPATTIFPTLPLAATTLIAIGGEMNLKLNVHFSILFLVVIFSRCVTMTRSAAVVVDLVESELSVASLL